LIGWLNLGVLAMAETDTGVAVGGLGKIVGDAVIAFNHVRKIGVFY
jgi:hypothetical protein